MGVKMVLTPHQHNSQHSLWQRVVVYAMGVGHGVGATRRGVMRREMKIASCRDMFIVCRPFALELGAGYAQE